MSASPSLMLRVIIALVLMAGFYVLAMVTAAVLLYLPYAEIVYAHRIHFQLAVGCIAGAFVILWSIVPRWDRFTPPGPVLEPEMHPKLFQSLTATARATGQIMPSEVYLIPEVNAWVAQRGGWMGLGSRRVMALGLPLLQILTVSQLRAVLAHEFGHFYGGDTRLGPWIYKTHATIFRTLGNLRDSKVQIVFVWYAKLFLRITLAISRRQEYAADELASHVAGTSALVEGLKAIHGAALAFDSYMQQEFLPILNNGLLAPLAEGFSRFLSAPAVGQAVSERLEAELREGQSDPYDSHPPLRERITALDRLSREEQLARGEDAPAISLLGDAQEMEIRLLVELSGNQKIRSLKSVGWGDTGSEVYLPLWEKIVREHAHLLENLTVASLPETIGALSEFAAQVKDPPGMLLTREQRAGRAVGILGAALLLALKSRGWSLRCPPGEEVSCQRGELRIAPFKVVVELEAGEMQAETWARACAEAGISEMSLASPELAAGMS